MALNTTQEQIIQSAESDFQKKLDAESNIKKKIKREYFLPISILFLNFYSQTGTLPELTNFNLNLKNILDDNHSRVSRLFSRNIRDKLGNPENAASINDTVNFRLDLLKDADVSDSLKSISTTTHKDLKKSVDDLLLASALENIELTNNQVATRARRRFNDLSNSRLETIGMTETQGAAEGAKNVEANVLNSNNAVFAAAGVSLATSTIQKTWITKMDNRVRAAHVLAEGQKIGLNEAFNVGGELMMYPGDDSLGATLGNIINCRCTSIMTIT